MFSGKGGVGKTTCACGIARQLARQHPDQRVMLISTDPAHSLGDVLQVTVNNQPQTFLDFENLQVRALDAAALLAQFRTDYGEVLELLVERGSFVEDDDLSPVWDMGWPGLDELMALLEIERLLRESEVDRVVVDMAPSGHTLNLFSLMDFLDTLLASLGQFQAKHRYLSETLSGRYTPDQADDFIQNMQRDLAEGRSLLQDPQRTACWIVAIPEPMSFAESQRFRQSLGQLQIPMGGVIVNRLAIAHGQVKAAQQPILRQFQQLFGPEHAWGLPLQTTEPVGGSVLDALLGAFQPLSITDTEAEATAIAWPESVSPGFADFLEAGRRLILVGGKGGVGKTTVSAAIGWHLAHRYPDAAIRMMSIDPAHSLGDALEQELGHEPLRLYGGLTAQEVDARVVLDQFRADYLWELAEMISGDTGADSGIQLAYGPEAWRQIVAQALPGIDEMLSLITVMDLLERNEQQIIILDTAPTGHLLRFLEMPTALGDWLAWIFKLWIKYKDVVGRVDLMGRLRTLRKRVMEAQAKLKDPQYTEFIGVVQNQSAILAEAQRLSLTLTDMGIAQNYLVHNRYQSGDELPRDYFAGTVVRLPLLPANTTPLEQVKAASDLLFDER
ncbi:arsenic transporter [filamentous cyanobacterium CCP5]|nr:arsenic transporter [filamentous cyanobacterium CCP5]